MLTVLVATVFPILSEEPMNLAHDIAALPSLSVAQLRGRYAEVFGEGTNSRLLRANRDTSRAATAPT